MQKENTSQVSKLSPLLELLTELRNKIYFDVLVSDKPLGIAKETHIYDVHHNAPAFLQTCRQIREEARTIFYSNNAFVAKGYHTWIIDFFAWFKALDPKDAFSIKHYRVDCGTYSVTEATWQFRNLLYHFKSADSTGCNDDVVTKLLSMFVKFYSDIKKRGRSPYRGVEASYLLHWRELKGFIGDKQMPSTVYSNGTMA